MITERKKKIASWERRLKSMYNKAIQIQSEAIDELGLEHPYTDELDNLLVALEDLCNDTPKFRKGEFTDWNRYDINPIFDKVINGLESCYKADANRKSTA